MAKKAQSRLWYQSETHWIDSAAVTADTPAPFEETEAKTPEVPFLSPCIPLSLTHASIASGGGA